MTMIVKVGRLHLVDRFSYTWLVWGILAVTFALNFALFAVIPVTQPEGNFTGALVTIYIFMIVIGVQAATRVLPFAFTLGVSRRTYYLGTVALVLALCVAYASVLTALWALEGATNGWGLQLHFFRVPWILDGPWYQVLITSFALLSLVFLLGLWVGLIYRRWGTVGGVVFFSTLAVLLVGASLLITWAQWWPRVGAYLSGLDILTASLWVLVLAAVVALGGYVTIRRITV
jgi:hypothetical protein